MPGLSEDQLNDYLRRLAPDRQVFLNRPGMGYTLGDGFMRALVGERRWRQEAIVANVPTIEHPTNQEIVVRSRGIDFDDSDEESHASAPLGLTVPGSPNNSRNTTPPSDEERRRELAHEGDVITSAIWDGIYSLVTQATVAVTQFAIDEVVAPLGGFATTVGLVGSVSVTVLSVGAGLWQYSRPTTSSNTGQQSAQAFSGLLLSTTVLGGLSTGVMLYARSAIRKPATKSPPPSKAPPK